MPGDQLEWAGSNQRRATEDIRTESDAFLGDDREPRGGEAVEKSRIRLCELDEHTGTIHPNPRNIRSLPGLVVGGPFDNAAQGKSGRGAFR